MSDYTPTIDENGIPRCSGKSKDCKQYSEDRAWNACCGVIGGRLPSRYVASPGLCVCEGAAKAMVDHTMGIEADLAICCDKLKVVTKERDALLETIGSKTIEAANELIAELERRVATLVLKNQRASDQLVQYDDQRSRLQAANTREVERRRKAEVNLIKMRDVLLEDVCRDIKRNRPPVLKVKRLPHAKDLPLPAYARDGDACLDLYAAEDVEIEEGGSATVPTGLCVEIPSGHRGRILSRSSWLGGELQVQVGTIDSGYRGQLMVIIDMPFLPNSDMCTPAWAPSVNRIERGERIAQLEIAPVSRVQVQEVEELSETERGDGGFGSTGR